MSEVIPLCNSAELLDGGLAVPFDVIYGGQICRAFAIRFNGHAYAYLNRCSHVAMEMDTNPIDFLMRLANTLCVPHMVLCIVPIRAPALVALAVAA
jgi:nitrite reductase/ring-hydroxylating ferredoxin subunit